MCGIFGFTGKPSQEAMIRGLLSFRHRGRDDQGEYAGNSIHIGMTRLSIIDLAGGHQPMAALDGQLHIVFNGEIFNYVELREELEAKGFSFRTKSDTETILYAYRAFGPTFAHRLNGMFAIALWDEREKKLILVRDRYGEKPLFYSMIDSDIVFGSEIKSLLYHPNVSKELDDEALSHYFGLRNIPAPFTAYRSIRALLPGHMLIWQNGKSTVSKWYDLPMKAEESAASEDELAEKLNELLRDSVKIRLRSDVGYGAYLSGGVDSSTVTAMMSEFSPKPVQTFSLSFSDSPAHKKDPYYAALIAKRYNTIHQECVMSSHEFERDARRIIMHLDQPFAGVNSSFWLSQFMKQHVTVALSGDGADDVFGSYGHHRLARPVQQLRAAGAEGKVDYGFFGQQKEKVQTLSQYEPWEWRLAYAAFMEHEKEDLFSPKGKERFGPFKTAKFLKKIYESSSPKLDPLNRMLYLDIHTLLPNEILYYADMLSMAHTLEVRAPFLDYRVVDFACSIPGRLKIKDMNLKYILKKVAARYVPDEILNRPKEGFVLPKNTWFRGPLRPWVEKVLNPERLNGHGFFNPEYVESLLKHFFAGDESLTFKIWTLIVFQIWYEQNV